MRNTEERVLAVKLRAKEIEVQKRMHKGHMLSISSVAVCLMLIVGLSFAMPRVMDSMYDGDYTNFGTAAGIFEGSNSLGYVLIGFLAFALGVSVTILSYRISLKNKINQENKEDRDD